MNVQFEKTEVIVERLDELQNTQQKILQFLSSFPRGDALSELMHDVCKKSKSTSKLSCFEGIDRDTKLSIPNLDISLVDRKEDKKIDKKEDKKTDKKSDRKEDKKTDKKEDKKIDKKSDKKEDKKIEKKEDKKTDNKEIMKADKKDLKEDKKEETDIVTRDSKEIFDAEEDMWLQTSVNSLDSTCIKLKSTHTSEIFELPSGTDIPGSLVQEPVVSLQQWQQQQQQAISESHVNLQINLAGVSCHSNYAIKNNSGVYKFFISGNIS